MRQKITIRFGNKRDNCKDIVVVESSFLLLEKIQPRIESHE